MIFIIFKYERKYSKKDFYIHIIYTIYKALRSVIRKCLQGYCRVSNQYSFWVSTLITVLAVRLEYRISLSVKSNMTFINNICVIKPIFFPPSLS